MMYLNRLLLIPIVSMVLISCGEKQHESSEQQVLEYSADVTPWVTKIAESSGSSVDKPDDGLFDPLLTQPIPSEIPSVFTSSLLGSGDNSIQLKSSKVKEGEGDRADFSVEQTGLGRKIKVATRPQSKNSDLSQAQASELKYAGLLAQNDRSWGLVKVGDRLYSVNVGDAIGLGRWVVSDLNTQTMQLKIANRVVAYGKN